MIIEWIVPIASYAIHYIWKHVFVENEFNFMQLGATTLRVGCPCEFLVQNIHKQT
jgi:hypothetical protein